MGREGHCATWDGGKAEEREGRVGGNDHTKKRRGGVKGRGGGGALTKMRGFEGGGKKE